MTELPVADRGRHSPDVEHLFALHLAEYDALMNRCNYFITLHVSALGLAPSLVIFVVQLAANTRDPIWQGYIIWFGAIAIQTLLHVWVTLIEDQYNAVHYMETELRDSISALLPTLPPRAFWRYEKHLERVRMKESWWGEWIAPVVLAVMFAGGVWWRREFLLTYEVIPIIANAAFIVALAIRTHLRIQVRKSFARNLVQRTEA